MATAMEPPTYWCHQCHTSVRPNAGNDILCPLCNGGFIEEIENTPGVYFPPHRQRSTVVFGGEPRDSRGIFGDGDLPAGGNQVGRHPPIFQVLQAMSAILQQAREGGGGGGQAVLPPADAIAAAAAGGAAGGAGEGIAAEGGGGGGGIGGIDPMVLVQNVFGGRAGNVEVFFDTGTGARRLPANFGDYFFGPGLDQLIQQLAENDPNRYGTPPASKSAIDAMPIVKITKEHMTGDDDAAQCAVCKDEFELGSEVRQMPCKHLYHEDCILPWLSQHNSCPVCRHEMPTDDPEYNNGGNSNQGRSAAAASGGGGGDGGNSTIGRGSGGSRGFTIWGSPITSNHPAEGQESGSSRPSSDEIRSGNNNNSSSNNNNSSNRRASFQFPWPFRSSSSPPPPPPPPSSSGPGGGGSSGSNRDEPAL